MSAGSDNRADAGRSEAGPSDEALVAAAREVLAHAHAPYSGFRVGAALLVEDGRVFTGCNVENASLGLTICAERAAAVKAVSEGAKRFRRIAVATEEERPSFPCGACRQFLAEFGEDLEVLIGGTGGGCERATLADLLPGAFRMAPGRTPR